MSYEIYPCGCPVKPGQAECEIKEPHATIADFNLDGPPGEPGPPGPHNEDFEIKDYDEWLRENLKAINSSSFEPRPRSHWHLH